MEIPKPEARKQGRFIGPAAAILGAAFLERQVCFAGVHHSRSWRMHDGIRRRWWINVASAVSLIELAKNLSISPPPSSRQGRLFPPCWGNPVISFCMLRGNLLLRPVELRRSLHFSGAITILTILDRGDLLCGRFCAGSRPRCARRLCTLPSKNSRKATLGS